jgi:hypothetical protein
MQMPSERWSDLDESERDRPIHFCNRRLSIAGVVSLEPALLLEVSVAERCRSMRKRLIAAKAKRTDATVRLRFLEFNDAKVKMTIDRCLCQHGLAASKALL